MEENWALSGSHIRPQHARLRGPELRQTCSYPKISLASYADNTPVEGSYTETI
jgi:hypothetical protein